MTKEEMLYQAYKKANKNGYKNKYFEEWDFDLFIGVVYFKKDGEVVEIGIETILFDHKFCKAFSIYIHKTNQYKKLNDYSEVINRHYDHLQKQFEKELVWSKDRLEYISKFL